MTNFQAREILKKWFLAEELFLELAIFIVLSKKEKQWLTAHPELFVHPRDAMDESTLGVHQTWYCNLMPYREIRYRGRMLYVFDFHINDLLQ